MEAKLRFGYVKVEGGGLLHVSKYYFKQNCIAYKIITKSYYNVSKMALLKLLVKVIIIESWFMKCFK